MEPSLAPPRHLSLLPAGIVPNKKIEENDKQSIDGIQETGSSKFERKDVMVITAAPVGDNVHSLPLTAVQIEHVDAESCANQKCESVKGVTGCDIANDLVAFLSSSSEELIGGVEVDRDIICKNSCHIYSVMVDTSTDESKGSIIFGEERGHDNGNLSPLNSVRVQSLKRYKDAVSRPLGNEELICKFVEDTCSQPFLHNAINDNKQQSSEHTGLEKVLVNSTETDFSYPVKAAVGMIPSPGNTDNYNDILQNNYHIGILNKIYVHQDVLIDNPESFQSLLDGKISIHENQGEKVMLSQHRITPENVRDMTEKVACPKDKYVSSPSQPASTLEHSDNLREMTIPGANIKEELASSPSQPVSTVEHSDDLLAASHGNVFLCEKSSFEDQQRAELPNAQDISARDAVFVEDYKSTGLDETEYLTHVHSKYSGKSSNGDAKETGLEERSLGQNQALCFDCPIVPRSELNRGKKQAPTSNVTPSFLCFLPDTLGRPVISQSNGTAGNNFQDSSVESRPLIAARKRVEKHDVSDRTLRSVHVNKGIASTKGCKKIEAISQDSSDSEKATLEVRKDEVPLEDTRSRHEHFESSKEAVTQRAPEEQLETRNADNLLNTDEQEADLLLSHEHTRKLSASEDESAFEITEFFEAFREGNDHLLDRLRRQQDKSVTLASVQADKCASALEPVKSSSKLPSSDDELASDETKGSNVLKDEESNGAHIPGHVNKAADPVDLGKNGRLNRARQSSRDDTRSFSEKWYDDTEAADCVSATFSGPLPFSGPIAYAGQIPYSGSISLRSDSSTASTHSFAFPILPCEWNSSPVKMAQPDQKYLRRRWTWWLCCFCCKKPSTLFD